MWMSKLNQLDDVPGAGDMKAVGKLYINDLIPLLKQTMPAIKFGLIKNIVPKRL